MSAISNFLETKILAKIFNGTDFNIPGIWVQLHTGDPGEDCTASVAGENSRNPVTFAPASGNTVVSNSTVEWTSVSTAETFSHVSLWDAVTSGNSCWKGALTTPRAVLVGDTFRIPAGNITISLE